MNALRGKEKTMSNEASCACLKVMYHTIANPDGSHSGKWRCTLCQNEFIPRKMHEALLREPQANKKPMIVDADPKPWSLRDIFAVAALQGLAHVDAPFDTIALEAYRQADAMMEERKK
jgi:hypothetical protein